MTDALERRIIPWPDGDARFSDLVDPLRKAYDHLDDDVIPYVGYNVGDQHINMDILTSLSRDGLEMEADQGRDKVTTLLSLAVQLGIAHGRRLERNSLQTQLALYEEIDRRLRERDG